MRRSSQSAACALAVLAVLVSPAAASQQCHVTFRADGAEPLGGLELRVDYSGAAGSFDGTGDGVKCTGLAPASWQLARDDDAGMGLDLGLISGAGVPLPQDVWRCDFTAAAAAPSAGDFLLTVDEAVTPVSEPVSVEVSVSDISCDPGAVCGDGIIEATEQCDEGVATVACDGDCRLTNGSQRCSVTFVASGTGILGGLQFGVDYSDASGVFQGEGIDVDCSRALTSSYTAVEDLDVGERLNLALVSPGGLVLPVNLWTCTFVTGGTALVTSNFHYVEVFATDVEVKPKTVSISATASACVGMAGVTVCGDANGNGTIQSSDALQILRAAVGTPGPCAPQRCDTDNSNSISSSDALRVLKKAVGQSVALTCPA